MPKEIDRTETYVVSPQVSLGLRAIAARTDQLVVAVNDLADRAQTIKEWVEALTEELKDEQ